MSALQVIILDPTQENAAELLSVAEMFYANNIPLRLVFVTFNERLITYLTLYTFSEKHELYHYMYTFRKNAIMALEFLQKPEKPKRPCWAVIWSV